MIATNHSPWVRHRRSFDTITNPQVIVEVLSKSTKGYDREDKFAAYRTNATFQEYLLIDSDQIHLEQYSKTGKKRWELREYDEEDIALALASIPFQISLEELYNKVNFAAAEFKKDSTDTDDACSS